MSAPELGAEVEAAMEKVRESELLTTGQPRGVGVAYLRWVGERCEELAAELEAERRKHGD